MGTPPLSLPLILEQLALADIAEELLEHGEVLAASRGLVLGIIDDDAVLQAVMSDLIDGRRPC